MNILIIHPQMALYGGAELVIAKLAQYLIKHSHNVTVMTLSTDSNKEYDGIKFILPPEKKRISYRLRGGLASIYDILRMQVGLSKLCKTHIDNFDVINVHNFPAIWAVPNHKKVVWMCNEVPDLWHNAKVSGVTNKLFYIARYLDSRVVRMKNPVSIVADTRCADIFKKRYGFYPKIIPYGIDGEFFSQCKHTPIDGEFRVICTSMISPSKNQLAILQAVKEIRFKIPNVRVILSGYREPSHPYSVMLDNYIKANSLDVTYIPLTSREKLREIYSASSVAVFVGKGQGSWLSPFEQLSMGIPVIVSPSLTCSNIIFWKDVGIITDDIRNALFNVYKDYPRFKEQALRGQEFVLRELTWGNFGRKMESILAEGR
jgi:glycosyltransferase involved in cell wall biosynthesis